MFEEVERTNEGHYLSTSVHLPLALELSPRTLALTHSETGSVHQRIWPACVNYPQSVHLRRLCVYIEDDLRNFPATLKARPVQNVLALAPFFLSPRTTS